MKIDPSVIDQFKALYLCDKMANSDFYLRNFVTKLFVLKIVCQNGEKGFKKSISLFCQQGWDLSL